jgi:hypothetical protein
MAPNTRETFTPIPASVGWHATHKQVMEAASTHQDKFRIVSTFSQRTSSWLQIVDVARADCSVKHMHIDDTRKFDCCAFSSLHFDCS